MTPMARILIVDDESVWRENFAAWIPKDLAEQDAVGTVREAAERLRKFHYDLVLLDLSMDIKNRSNRDTRPIQEYLAKKPEGTAYFVVSATADEEDTATAAYELGAAWVFFKKKKNYRPSTLAEKVAEFVVNSQTHRAQAVVNARAKLAPEIQETNIISALKLRGIPELYPILDHLFRPLAPVSQHRDRPHLAISNGRVVGLFWSRRYGVAVSAVIAPQTVDKDDAEKALSDWLGFPVRGSALVDTVHHARILAFKEPTISDAHFDLPSIKLPS
jgi:CheY-like chemotaxis protein